MDLTSSLTITGLLSLVFMFVNFLKYVVNFKSNSNAVITQIVVWAAGVGAVALGAQAAITKAIVVFGQPLGSMDAGSIIIAGLFVGSAASVGNQLLAAIDGSRSSATPQLVPKADAPPA